MAATRKSPVAATPAFEHCATPMAVVARDLDRLTPNPALLAWFVPGAHARLTLLDATPPRLSDAAVRASSEQRRVTLRGARLRAAGGDRAADVVLSPIDDATLLLEIQPVAADASASLRLSESLRGFAHEVKGPLAGMRGAAQLLQRRVEAADLRELASLIMAEADRLAGLADRLLAVRAQAQLAPANVHEVIERVIAVSDAAPGAPRIRRDYDPSLPPLALDADRLQQALLNLVRNAGEAGAREVVLRTRAEHAARLGDHAGLAVRIDVVDDGRGVPAALADTLYEPLVSGRADGSGLGLAIAREIAREHGGELVHASRPGATVFSLLLPVAG
jgi:two-component system nitrogen regulation sensor histidine kinase GlnL